MSGKGLGLKYVLEQWVTASDNNLDIGNERSIVNKLMMERFSTKE